MSGDVPLRILIVEDDADTRDNLRYILELDGHLIEEAATAAEVLEREGWSAYAIVRPDRMLRDDGPGFTPDQRRKVFEAFYTTKTKGTGLGRAICRAIVEAHKGRITLGALVGPGAESIIIPRGNP